MERFVTRFGDAKSWGDGHVFSAIAQKTDEPAVA
jgi:hypothetical protein